jgi:hypothetical protein
VKRNWYIEALFRIGLLIWGLSHWEAKAQVIQPDCIIFFHFTASGQTSPLAPNAGFSNLTTGCTTWNVSYANTGFTGITLAFQSAPNVAGVAGSWSTFAGGTILSGINPNTNTTGAFTWLTGYNPWVRMALTSAAGTGEVDGAVYGWRIPSAGGPGSGTQPVSGTVTANQGTAGASAWPVDGSGHTQPISGTVTTVGPAASGVAPGGNPIQSVGLASGATGGLLYPLTACDSSSVVTVTAGNTTQIVALTSGRSIRVCSFSLSISLAGTAQWQTGTGTNCGSSNANLTGAYSIATGVTSAQGTGLGEIFKTPVSNELCLAAVTGNVTGVVSYAVY